MTSLARQLALPFLAFVIAGSISLTAWIRAEALREGRRQFVEMARSNARFIREAQLPRTERTSEGLSQALGVEVQLIGAGIAEREQSEWPEDGDWRALADGREAAAAAVDSETRLILARPSARAALFSDWPKLAAALLGFWVLSLGLAWVLARRIVHPLRRLAEKLPRIADEDSSPALLEAGRNDEIGQLARAYTETRAQLAAERAARTKVERLATLGKMATGLAHEINNPIAAIRLHAQLLDEELPGAARERVQIILGESSRIESLVSQWMFLARPQPPQTSVHDLAEIAGTVISALQPAAEHAGVTIRNETSPGLWVRVDRRRIAQAITNLVTNAIHASAGGEVVLRGKASVTPSNDPESEGRPLDFLVELSVADSGRGFSAEALRRGAELFYSEKEGGMGLGLTVTAEIARAHGGDVRLANQADRGANVALVLPAARGM